MSQKAPTLLLGQYTKGVEKQNATLAVKAEKALTRIKHYLWHGNVFQALQTIDRLEGDIENVEDPIEVIQKLQKGVYELHT